MTDIVSKDVRSKIMSSVPQKNTRPELVLRSLLHRSGFRFRIHRKDLPGTPDIVLPKYKTAIFIHGCFWHQHPGCSKSRRPSSNINYWNRKLDENISRDRAKTNELEKEGWRVLIVWQCEIENKTFRNERLKELVTQIKHHDSLGNVGIALTP